MTMSYLSHNLGNFNNWNTETKLTWVEHGQVPNNGKFLQILENLTFLENLRKLLYFTPDIYIT